MTGATTATIAATNGVSATETQDNDRDGDRRDWPDRP
jgi:hypothetical protein